jgi:hypothetical protein
MARVSQQLNLESGAIFKLYTAAGIAADVDLSIDYPGWSNANGRNDKLPRWVEYAGGDLVVEDTQGNSTTLPAANAAARPMAPLKIIDVGTTATFIFVIW